MKPVFAAALAALLGAMLACRGGEPPPNSGFIDAATAAVAAQVAGRVQAIPVREGDHVRKGQLIVQLDARDRAAAVAQAEANQLRANAALRGAEASFQAALPTLKGAGADVARSKAALDEAETEFERTQRLVQNNSAPQSQLDSARARMLEARAALQSLLAGKDVARGKIATALAAVEDARAQVRSSDAALTLARVQLDQAQVTAPFDGVVVNRDVEEGEWAAPGTPLVTVEDSSRLWVRLDVEETQLAGVKLGTPAQVRVIALPDRTFDGRVFEIGAEAEFAINRDVRRGRPDIRTFRVRVALDDASAELRPGMTAEVKFKGEPQSAPARKQPR